MSRFGSARAVIDALPQLAAKAGRKLPLKAAPRDAAKSEIDRAAAIGARLIASCEADYPRPLAEIPDAPPLIYLRGYASVFSKPAVAIIGARNASAIGRKMARLLAEGLGAHGAEGREAGRLEHVLHGHARKTLRRAAGTAGRQHGQEEQG